MVPHGSMRGRTPAVSLAENIASLAVATGVTLGTAFVVLAALGRGFAPVPGFGPEEHDVANASERVVFLVPRAPAFEAPRARVVRAMTQADRQRFTTRTGLGTIPQPHLDSASSVTAAVTPVPTVGEATSSSRASFAPAVAGAIAGFRRSSAPARVDSVVRAASERLSVGLVTGSLEPPPLTQAERDVKLRAEAFEVAAARGAGVPIRYTMAGGSIPVPLPFGGPSRKQRERDRAIFAELMVAHALRQAKVDSVVAARQRRRADSLARLPDSLRGRTRPQR